MQSRDIPPTKTRTDGDSPANTPPISDHNLTTQVVYFIGSSTPGTCVKIGISKCVEERLATLQYSSPVDLEVLALAEGGRAVEQAYHQRFAEYRSHGEWFFRGQEIVEEMKRLNPDRDFDFVWRDDDI